MAHIATKHFSVIDVTITDDFLDRRTKAALATSNRWRRLPTAGTALDKACMVAEALIEASNGGPIPSALRQEVGADINRNAPTHDPADESKDFEVAVVASVGAIMLLESNANRTDHCNIFAEALSAAMDISATKGAPRVAELWNDLARAARRLGDGTAERQRTRQPVVTSEPSAAIQALDANARMDQEEINVLWWTLSDWSTLGARRLSAMPTDEATVAAAIELSEMLAWPAVRALRQLAHRNVQNNDGELTLNGLAIANPELRGRLDAVLAPMEALVTSHPRVFVALNAVMAINGAASTDVPGTVGVEGTQTKSAWKWAERLVREISLAKSAGGILGPIE